MIHPPWNNHIPGIGDWEGKKEKKAKRKPQRTQRSQRRNWMRKRRRKSRESQEKAIEHTEVTEKKLDEKERKKAKAKRKPQRTQRSQRRNWMRKKRRKPGESQKGYRDCKEEISLSFSVDSVAFLWLSFPFCPNGASPVIIIRTASFGRGVEPTEVIQWHTVPHQKNEN
ncbi:hypothetical protein [Longilinea arvoryzae]|uniref:hypothetical protein n=1 Tax=Longilinea arvoryzae TaxID=360412 RepID=UPI000946430B|nr:hypothetical protein [Longilinea arvoryzae]